MALIHPFRGIRPRDDLAQEVIAPPYDVLSEAEAREIVAKHPKSFLHVTRPEVDLPRGSDAHSAVAYQKARENLDTWLERGWLVQDEKPAFYRYSQTWRGRTQVGLMALCSVEAYDQGRIKRHELTRPDKEDDRVAHMEALNAQVGLVFLAARSSDAVGEAMAAIAQVDDVWQVNTDDDVTHALAPVDDPSTIASIQAAFDQADALYIADGHHRSAAASRVCAQRGALGSSKYFLAGIFPEDQLRVLAYNRLVLDLNGHSQKAFVDAVGQRFEMAPGQAIPAGRGQWSMYLGGAWLTLTAKQGVVPNDPVGQLDAQVLQTEILEPILGIQNPRTDQRIRFVGGIRGPEALERAVDTGEAAVAFHLFPTGLDQLFAVADAGALMPPKSTWFEPKLRGGVVLHRFED